jgi:large subunit ribosomal protein L22
MNTASRDRALLPAVRDVLPRRTPISKLKLSKDDDGQLRVALHTSKPQNVQMHIDELRTALSEEIGGDKSVKVDVIPEARAVAKFVRTSPRKARLVIDAIKGKRVSEALAMLRFIPNHAAEHIAKVLNSAAHNAKDGFYKEPDELKVLNILADGGPSLKRVRARAQGRAFRILKRTCHLTVILAEAEAPRPRRPVTPKAAKVAKSAPAAKVRKTPEIADEPPVKAIASASATDESPEEAGSEISATADQSPEEGA